MEAALSLRGRGNGFRKMIRVNNPYEVAWRPDMTVQDVLDELKFTFRMIAVKVNGEPVL